jgi:hypothetical protein
MTDNNNMFTTLGDPKDHEHVTFGDNSRARIIGLGRIVITKDLSISNVLFVESLVLICYPLHNYMILD